MSIKLRNLGYKSPYSNTSGYKDKGIKVKWNEIEFNSYTLLAKYLKENVDIFKDKKIATIIKGISKNIKLHKKYCGYDFRLSSPNAQWLKGK